MLPERDILRSVTTVSRCEQTGVVAAEAFATVLPGDNKDFKVNLEKQLIQN